MKLRQLVCPHSRMEVDFFDQTLGVSCPDCYLQSWCWDEQHVPENLWNLACKNDPEAVPSERDRNDYCAICEEMC